MTLKGAIKNLKFFIYRGLCALGWVDLTLFLNFMHLQVVWGTPRYDMGMKQKFFIFIQKPMRATTL